jgi:hypothetical protein
MILSGELKERLPKEFLWILASTIFLGNYSFGMQVAVVSTLSIIGVKAWKSR